ncbi:MAG: hypothetical protein WBD07_18510 [Vicinamibacterales bacterium]
MQTRRFAVLAAIVATTAAMAAPNLFAQTAQTARDPVLGTWVLNLEKSKFEGIAAPGKRTMTFSAVGDAIKHVTSTLPAGVPGVVVAGANQYTAKYGGPPVFIDGSFLDTVELKQIDPRTVERIGKVGGMAVETYTRVLSADGKTLTVTTKGTNPTTMVDYSSVQVFERQ